MSSNPRNTLHTPSLHGSALIGFTSWQRQRTLRGRKQAIHLLYILITYVCSLSAPWPRIILHKWPPGGELSIPVLKIGTTLNTAEIIFCSWKVPQQVCMMGAELRCPLVTTQFTVWATWLMDLFSVKLWGRATALYLYSTFHFMHWGTSVYYSPSNQLCAL